MEKKREVILKNGVIDTSKLKYVFPPPHSLRRD